MTGVMSFTDSSLVLMCDSLTSVSVESSNPLMSMEDRDYIKRNYVCVCVLCVCVCARARVCVVLDVTVESHWGLYKNVYVIHKGCVST